jgi:hypothetical protein
MNLFRVENYGYIVSISTWEERKNTLVFTDDTFLYVVEYMYLSGIWTMFDLKDKNESMINLPIKIFCLNLQIQMKFIRKSWTTESV